MEHDRFGAWLIAIARGLRLGGSQVGSPVGEQTCGVSEQTIVVDDYS